MLPYYIRKFYKKYGFLDLLSSNVLGAAKHKVSKQFNRFGDSIPVIPTQCENLRDNLGEEIGSGSYKTVYINSIDSNQVIKIQVIIDGSKNPKNEWIEFINQEIYYANLLKDSGFTANVIEVIRCDTLVAIIEERVFGKTLADVEVLTDEIIAEVQQIVNHLKSMELYYVDNNLQNFMYGHTSSNPIDKVYLIDVGTMISTTDETFKKFPFNFVVTKDWFGNT